MQLISQSEAARRAGVSRTAIQKHLATGRIKSDGAQVDVASLERWISDRATVQPAATAAQPAVQDGETPAEAAERIVRAFGAEHDFAEAKRIRENYLALLTRLEYDQKSGVVVEIADVAKAVGVEFARVRTRLLAIPAEQAPSLFHSKTVADLQDRLLTLVTRVLEELTADGGSPA